MDQTAPSAPQLGPMSLSDMLDAAFRLYRKHFLTFVGIVALLLVPMAILQFLAQLPYAHAIERFAAAPLRARPGQSPFDLFPFAELLPYYGLIAALSIVQYLVIYNLMIGALANAIASSYLGRPISILGAYRLGWRRALALLGASLAPLLLWLAGVLLIAGCAFGAIWTLGLRTGEQPSVGLAVLAVLGLIGLVLIFMLAGLFFYVRLLLATQAIVIEGCGAFEGLRRSWRLVGQSLWRSIGIVLLVFLMASIVSYIVQLPMLAVAMVSTFVLKSLVLSQGLNALATYGALILILPLQFIIFTLLYYDLRVRKEGYDLELLAQRANP